MFVFSQKLSRSLAAILGLAAAAPSVALAQRRRWVTAITMRRASQTRALPAR